MPALPPASPIAAKRYRLPPLNALKIFEAVMRHGSIRQAADELCITPQAVSHQMKLLETSLGVPLFTRQARSVEATPEARRLVEYVRHGLDHIAEGIATLERPPRAPHLYLHVSPYFASVYLIRHLGEFTRLFPDIDVRISIGVEGVDLHADKVDAAILWRYARTGDSQAPGCIATPLIDDLKVIACSPALMAADPIAVPRDLLRHTLISPLIDNTLWADTLALLGLPGIRPASVVHLHTHEAMREGALAGLGVGLISYLDAVSAIREGRLVAPFGLDVLRGLADDDMPKFILLRRDDRPPSALLTQFTAWLIRTVSAENAFDPDAHRR